MTDDDVPLSLRAPAHGATALNGLATEDLDPYSVDDLKERIEALETEIKRSAAAMERKKNRLSEASALFSFKTS